MNRHLASLALGLSFVACHAALQDPGTHGSANALAPEATATLTGRVLYRADSVPDIVTVDVRSDFPDTPPKWGRRPESFGATFEPRDQQAIGFIDERLLLPLDTARREDEQLVFDWQLEDIPVGRYQVVYAREALQSIDLTTKSQPVEANLTRKRTVTLDFVDAASGRPVQVETLGWADWVGEKPNEPVWLGSVSRSGSQATAAGRCLDGLRAERLVLNVRAAGYDPMAVVLSTQKQQATIQLLPSTN
jgi:hypothetical protein